MRADNQLRLLAVIASLCATTLGAADDSPYTAYVTVEGAEVVAGPGHRFYATERLPRGTPIEVYREESSGWLAIRPSENAFSWVPAQCVERSAEDEQAGRITGPTPAWIGTAVEHVNEHRQQVTLKEGELVQILGEKNVGGGEQPQVWLKIAPPAGEFRWIHLRDVSRQMPPPLETGPEAAADKPVPSESENEAATSAEPRRVDLAGPAIALADIERPAPRRDARVMPAQFQNSPGTIEKPISPDGFVARKRRGSEHVQATPVVPAPLARPSSPNRSPSSVQPLPAREQPTSPAPAAAGVSGDDLAAQLQRIELDLSLMVAQDKSLWDLAAIKTRVRELVNRGADPTGRGRARLVLDKVEQFEQAFAVQNYGPIRANSATSASGSQPKAAGLEDPRYDAQGWLKPVVSRRSEKPIAPYAVVDQDGQPLCFVTPQPGVNLNRYLNKQVGVYGRRGYLEELHKPHVTAERIIDLERQWR
jgi:hypothetical protein